MSATEEVVRVAEAVIITLAVVFVSAGLLLLVANHFGLSPVPFYIIAGLITGTVVESADVLDLALWGIAFLVFVFGIRVELAELQTVLRDGETAAVTQLLVVAPIAFAVGLAAGELFGFERPVENAIYIAAAATLSSTLVGAGLLEHEIRDNLVHGRLASSVHFFDDLLAVGVLLVISAEVLTAEVVTSKIGFGVLFLVAALVVYRHGFPLLVRLAGDTDELVLMGSVSILIAFLAAAEYVGISIVVGAFAAGIAIRDDGAQALGVRNGIESIRDFFVAIFFVTIGALVSIPSIEAIVIAASLIVLVLVVNPIVMVLAFVYEGYDARTAYLTSTSLTTVSELSLVIAIQALVLDHLSIADAVFDAIILAAAVTMILTSLARRREKVIYDVLVGRVVRGRQTRKIDEGSHVTDDLTDHVIIVGYGRQGRLLAETCRRYGHPFVVLENDPVVWDDMRGECQNYVLGDAMADYPWEKARVSEARLIVSTVAHQPVSSAVLALETDADIVLRAKTSAEARTLFDRGALFVNVPSVLASDQLVENVEAVLDGEIAPADLRQHHRETLSMLERHGFATRYRTP